MTTYMSTPGNTAKLGTAHSNIQTVQRIRPWNYQEKQTGGIYLEIFRFTKKCPIRQTKDMYSLYMLKAVYC